MWSDLLALVGGWYSAYVSQIRGILETTQIITTLTPDGSGDYVTQTIANELIPDVWSAFVPWEHIIATVILLTFTICVFKFMRTILCKIL